MIQSFKLVIDRQAISKVSGRATGPLVETAPLDYQGLLDGVPGLGEKINTVTFQG